EPCSRTGRGLLRNVRRTLVMFPLLEAAARRLGPNYTKRRAARASEAPSDGGFPAQGFSPAKRTGAFVSAEDLDVRRRRKVVRRDAGQQQVRPNRVGETEPLERARDLGRGGVLSSPVERRRNDIVADARDDDGADAFAERAGEMRGLGDRRDDDEVVDEHHSWRSASAGCAAAARSTCVQTAMSVAIAPSTPAMTNGPASSWTRYAKPSSQRCMAAPALRS